MITNLVSRMSDAKVGETYTELLESVAKKDQEAKEEASKKQTLTEAATSATDEFVKAIQKDGYVVEGIGNNKLSVDIGGSKNIIIQVIGYK